MERVGGEDFSASQEETPPTAPQALRVKILLERHANKRARRLTIHKSFIFSV